MPYLTRANLEARFGTTLIADLETGGAVVADAIADASAEVDNYLASRYALPLASVPDAIARIAAQIARYNLWRRDVAADHPAYVAYKDALKDLAKIADGSMSLGLSPLGITPTQEGGVRSTENERVFDRDTLADY
jgi:phage gp36-like protein